MKPVMPLALPFSFIPLSPIHVGSGQSIEPSQYDIVQDGDNYFLTAFNLPRVFHTLSPALRTEYDNLLRIGDWTGIRLWLRKAATRSEHRLFRVQIQPEPAEEIRKNIDNPNRLGEIQLFTRDPAVGKPYLPGSSLKGAIRTAIVDSLARTDSANTRKLEYLARRVPGARFEAEVFGNVTIESDNTEKVNLYRDPLRQLALSDLAMPDNSTYIDRIQIVQPPGRRERGSNPEDIIMYREVTWSACDGENLRFAGQLRLSPHLANRRQMGSNCLPHALDLATICRQCNAFYRPRLEAEVKKFVQDSTAAGTLLKHAAQCDDHRCLVRLGRHSHFECVTVGEPYNQPPRRGFGNTRSYVAKSLPLGWAILQFQPVR